MKLVWDQDAWDDYEWWQAQDRKVLKRINILLRDITRNGNEGIGKPEPLKHGFHGYHADGGEGDAPGTAVHAAQLTLDHFALSGICHQIRAAAVHLWQSGCCVQPLRPTPGRPLHALRPRMVTSSAR